VIPATIHASPECAAAVFALPDYRVFDLPDNPGQFGVTCGGSEAEAREAVVALLREKYVGDWTYEALLLTAPPAPRLGHGGPCAWCAKHKRYMH
jgi:hypothetical protein